MPGTVLGIQWLRTWRKVYAVMETNEGTILENNRAEGSMR